MTECLGVVYVIASSFIDLGSQGTLTLLAFRSAMFLILLYTFLPSVFLFYLHETLIIWMFKVLTTLKFPLFFKIFIIL